MLESLAPKFVVPKKHISILYEPRDFYNHLINRIKTANKRIFLASLYLGYDKQLLDELDLALKGNTDLKLYVVVDALRGTREAPELCSASMLSPLHKRYPNQVRLALYRTPKLNMITKWLPKRVIEGVGLQHMKLYGFDDEIMLSGANLSSDYFTNRQDRYISINDKKVSDFFFDVHQSVSDLSLKLTFKNNLQQFTTSRPLKSDVMRAKANLRELFKPKSTESKTDHVNVYPVSQLTPFKIGNEHKSILHMLNKPGKLMFTCGYFNVEPEIGQALQNKECEVILASKYANGFYKSKGISGKIPHLYEILALKYLKKANLPYRLWQLGEVNNGGWTYHAKGIWGDNFTYIGSSNFTKRSYKHDLECGAFITGLDLEAEKANLLKNCGELRRDYKVNESWSDWVLLKLGSGWL